MMLSNYKKYLLLAFLGCTGIFSKNPCPGKGQPAGLFRCWDTGLTERECELSA